MNVPELFRTTKPDNRSSSESDLSRDQGDVIPSTGSRSCPDLGEYTCAQYTGYSSDGDAICNGDADSECYACYCRRVGRSPDRVDDSAETESLQRMADSQARLQDELLSIIPSAKRFKRLPKEDESESTLQEGETIGDEDSWSEEETLKLDDIEDECEDCRIYMSMWKDRGYYSSLTEEYVLQAWESHVEKYHS
jgi:hypothetical protein